MKTLSRKILLLLLIAWTCYSGQKATATEVATVSSPNGQNTVSLDLTDGKLSYTVSRSGRILVGPSRMGIITAQQDFTQKLVLANSDEISITEDYTLPVGKVSTYHNKYHELTATFQRGGEDMQVVFRCYDDGVAFRYALPGEGQVKITWEQSDIDLPSFDRCWGEKYASDYSLKYPERDWAATAAIENHKMSAPVLVRSTYGDDFWCLISEADVTGTYSASPLMSGSEAETGHFYYCPASAVETSLPMNTPWRTLTIGSLPEIIESTMLENLCPPSAFSDWSWIQPGFSSWDWGGLDGSSTHDFNVVKGFIDMAYEMHLPYYTLDEGWASSDYRLKDVTDYAASKGVKVIIWSHQNRFKNDDAQVYDVLANWKSLGFAGAKIDFFEDDSQEMIQKYDKILRHAANLQMVINFHGCTKPSGTRRTWPNLITCEAVYGGEQYYFNHLATPASHNVTLALTRNVIGPMDYTPVEFARLDGVLRHLTTWSHQVALAVLYESGIQCLSDAHDNLCYSPVRTLLAAIPAAWDELRCLEAAPDQYVTLARRSGDDWYLATISQDARTVQIPLSFLGSGNYTAQIYRDGTCASDIVYEEQTVNASTTLRLDVHATGGATVRISKNPISQPSFQRYEAEDGQRQGGITLETDGTGLCSGKYVGWVGNGNTITLTVNTPSSGVYDMTLFYITSDTRDTYIRTNGGNKDYITFQGNGFSWGGDGLAMKTVQVNLEAGNNTIEFGNDNGAGINIDRIVLSPSENYRHVKVSALPAWSDRPGYGPSEAVKATLTNESNQALSNIRVHYIIDDGTTVTETIPTLAADATIDYTFSQRADLSATGSHVLQVWVDDDRDNAIIGDMRSCTFSTLPAEGEKAVSWSSEGGQIHSFSAQQNDGEAAAKLIDADAATKWCETQNEWPWVIVELPGEYDVSRFVITDCQTKEANYKNLDEYDIYVSTADPSANEWTKVVDAYGRKLENTKVDNISPVKARYVKLVVKRPENDNAIRIYGFDIYGSEPSGIGLSSTHQSNTIAIYPTILHSGEQLHIANTSTARLSVYAANGALTLSRNIPEQAQIPLTLSCGIYLAKVSTPDVTETTRIIIK